MPAFIIGLLLGGVSGGATYWQTSDTSLSVGIGVLVWLVAWLLGVFGIAILDD